MYTRGPQSLSCLRARRDHDLALVTADWIQKIVRPNFVLFDSL